MKGLLLLIFLSFQVIDYAQTESDIKLAQYYYSNGEFEKAVGYFEKIYLSTPTKVVYTQYIDCLLAIKDYKSVEKIIKKQISLNKKDPELSLQLGFFYEELKEDEKARKIFSSVIKDLSYNPNQVKDVFSIFLKNKKLDYAKETLDKGSKMMSDVSFEMQYALLYEALGEKGKMFQSYFKLLEKYPEYATTVQEALSLKCNFLNESQDYILLKEICLDKIQKGDNNTIYNEFLIWLFLQNKNFLSAYTQVLGLEKRYKGSGERLMNLGSVCIENKEFGVARKCFQAVLAIGQEAPYYFEAESALLNASYIEITTQRTFTNEEIAGVIQDYKSVISRINNARKSFPIQMELSYILAYYAGEESEALSILEALILTPGLTDMQKAQIKMKIADIDVLKGEIWDASILYMQIDTDFKYELIGNEAKYKNARVFYFDGEFDYAQSQLNILKESTSKLIANDAMQLSIAITDNFGLDSNYQAMMWYASAELLIEQHKYTEAFTLFDSIKINYPFHSLMDEILFKKAQVMERQSLWADALGFYDLIIIKYPKDILADDALFKSAKIYENQLNDNVKALEFYMNLLLNYSGSLFTDDARKQTRLLRGDKIIED